VSTTINWIQLDSSRVDKINHREKKSGVEIEVSLSPNDIPEAVRGRSCPETPGHFLIEFKYANLEETEVRTLSDSVDVRLGKHSGRVYAIIVDGHKLLAKQPATKVELSLKIQGMLTRLGQESGLRRPALQRRANIARSVLETEAEQILPEITALSLG
jgi:hypothetical protein